MANTEIRNKANGAGIYLWQIERIKKVENVITALLDTGLDYQGIKAVLLNLDAPALNGVAI